MAATTTTKKRTSRTSKSGGNGNGKPTLNWRQMGQLVALSQLTSRGAIRARLGQSYGTDRDIYEALGYTKTPQYEHYQARYERQDIARAIINKPVQGCWRRPPTISERDDDDTPFEQAWEILLDKLRIYHYFSRVDKLASIGEYAVLLLGFDDSGELSQPVTSANDLLYIMPYTQLNAEINTYNTDSKNPRYGLPESYKISIAVGTSENSIGKIVHHSRVIHVTEDLTESNILGTPRLQSVLNRLQDLELVLGGSSEMFWRGGFPGMLFNLAEDAVLGDQALTDLQDEIEEYMHGLKRYLRVKGMNVENLAPQVADPSKHVEALIDIISCATNIPKRILMGSERGELGSSQDERNWANYLQDRQINHCEPEILRPTIDRLIAVGVLPKPGEPYSVKWEDLMSPSTKDVAEVGEIRSRTLKNYTESIGGGDIVPPETMLQSMGFSADEIAQIEAIVGDNVNLVDGDSDINADDIQQDGQPS